MCGYHFDHPGHLPSEQQIANVVAVVWALMKRYSIPATSILGHNELNQGKADPGKRFLALIRHLIGVKALIENDERMRRLVFGQKQVYEWEALSKYWFVVDRAASQRSSLRVAKAFCPPMGESSIWSPKNAFLSPEDHEGVDLYLKPAQSESNGGPGGVVRLVADGVCIFSGETHHCAQGKTLMFRHRQMDGAEVISVYSHLSRTGSIRVGDSCQISEQIGTLESHADGFLHFALAYGATWATDLSQRPDPPLNAKQNWILRRYLQPLQYLQERV
jgi:hypothetical protein